MKESTKSTVVMVATVLGVVMAVLNNLAGLPAPWLDYICMFIAGFGFGYSVRYFIGRKMARSSESAVAELERKVETLEAARETPHNRLCRDILRKLSELPQDERGPWAVRESEKEKIDGKADFVNAMESLIEQDCVRDVDVRWHLDGKANVYTGPCFGVTGKRYVDD